LMQRMEWHAASAGRLDAEVRGAAELSHRQARAAVRSGKVRLDGERVLDPAARVEAGAALVLDPAAPNPARTEPLGLRRVYRDDDLLVVDKPAGLNATPVRGSDEPSALLGAHRLCRGPRRPKIVHRLDRDTSGLMIFARGVDMARALRAAFDAHEIDRMYRCVIEGRPPRPDGLVYSVLLENAGRGRRGSKPGSFRCLPADREDPPPHKGPGQLAITRFHTVAHTEHRAALEVRLATGRTHQIRIHLAELGCPVLGERVYARTPGAPRTALHSATLGLRHPRTGQPLELESRWPADLASVTPRGSGW